ncbi:hypothetical protein PRZ48_004764 [Zasmidium cellare]|uniref:Amino acid transporter n=1 Tax=Zasmidium cellare TaxID=395010 RepID=A0ABR0ER38_ZASCE|nr:hypothetical protein PRZ48_004764 [Zasmidium cellare]
MAPGRAPATAQEKVTTIFDRTRDHAIVDETATLDEQTLTALGYKQQFKRDFSILESFSVSFAVLGLLPSIASTISYSLGYSGTGGAPCSLDYALAYMITTAATISNPDYTPKDWHIYLMFLAILTLNGLVAMQSTKFIGWTNVYTVKDIQDVVAGPYGQPWGSLCVQVLGKEQGLALFGLTMVAQFFCGLGTTITSSRIMFAYSRDGAVPGSRIWSTVDKRFKTPVYATWGVLLIAALVGLLLFAGPVAINAVFTIVAIGQYTSFTVRGEILDFDTPIALKLFFNNGRFKPGPWHLGKFSKPLNAIACSWWLLIVPALCFPAYKGSDLTLQTMNWTCLIYGGVMLIAMVWYAVDARKWFKGPRINVEHLDTLTPDDSQALHEAKEQ